MNKKWLKPWVFLCIMGCAGMLFYVGYTLHASRVVIPKVAVRENEVTELALNMYFHRGEKNTDIGRKAITAVVFNRMADKAKRWPRTVVGVIQDGHERGKNCDFSWTCDGLDDTPDDAVRYARDRALAEKWLTEYRKGAFVDPTKGATWLLYKEDTPPASWPALQKTGTFGMYSFYRYKQAVSAPVPSVKPGFLKGSPEAVRRAYHGALTEGLVFAKTGADIRGLA
ncbi:MAG: hypothetical protein RLZZ234_720, partial [Candidatus Parcubacteria bacterium]